MGRLDPIRSDGSMKKVCSLGLSTKRRESLLLEPLIEATEPDERWAMDFVHDRACGWEEQSISTSMRTLQHM
jgi:hypothetical protein